jgi:hypothetical protein
MERSVNRVPMESHTKKLCLIILTLLCLVGQNSVGLDCFVYNSALLFLFNLKHPYIKHNECAIGYCRCEFYGLAAQDFGGKARSKEVTRKSQI